MNDEDIRKLERIVSKSGEFVTYLTTDLDAIRQDIYRHLETINRLDADAHYIKGEIRYYIEQRRRMKEEQ